jgi:hypothetical protein
MLLNTHTWMIAPITASAGRERSWHETPPAPQNRAVVFLDLYGNRWDGVEREEERAARRTHLAR